MFDRIVKLIDSDKFEVVDGFFNKMGFGSLATSLGVFFSELSTLDVGQWAVIISLIGGLLFCIEKGLVIYIRLKNIQDSKHPHKDNCKIDEAPKEGPDAGPKLPPSE